jgi:hypothetical protein
MTEANMIGSLELKKTLSVRGYAMLRGVFAPPEVERIAQSLLSELALLDDAGILRSEGKMYGVRNLLQVVPSIAELPRREPLADLISKVLGPKAGLVRVLYFDKPPSRTWSLPWHRDMTIAVKDNRLPSLLFARPTHKAGIPHVEAPIAVLESMLTLRVHLDPITDENGPLSVIPGSHRTALAEKPGCSPADQEGSDAVALRAEAGDVLAMKPLILHASSASSEETLMHRRILHFEFAAERQLPDQYEWHTFIPATAFPTSPD